MNYELAKELKDAGFPQKEHELSTRDTGEWPNDVAPYKWPYNPTLEELISACGDKFRGLNSVWYSTGKVDWDANDKDGVTCTGSTPTIAIANLWLALNKNN